MATGLTAAVKDAFKSFADKFEYGVNEKELLSEGDDEEFESGHGKNGRQNDSQSQEKPYDSEGVNMQRMIEKAKAQDRHEQAKEPSVLRTN